MGDRRYEDPGSLESRIMFPGDEERVWWLTMLMDAYAVIDDSAASLIETETVTGRALACRSGCASCCRLKDIPMFPIERVGMMWYFSMRQSAETASRVIANTSSKDCCPFLVGEACSVYPVRPMACRLYNVFTRPCATGEDAYHTRRSDVLTPDAVAKRIALRITMPFYGIKDRAEQELMLDMEMLETQAVSIGEFDWSVLYSLRKPV